MTRPISHTVNALLLLGAASSVILSGACTTRRFTDDSHGPPATLHSNLININTADEGQLAQLPGVGPALAERIVEHRDRHGRFRKIEHLLLIEGVSERRFYEMRPLITAD